MRALHRWLLSLLPILVGLGLACAGVPAAAQEAELVLTSEEQAAADSIMEGKFVRAREIARKILLRDPQSVIGHFAMGAALHEGEGNIPAALREFRLARDLVETPGGAARPGYTEWHFRIMLSELSVLSDLGEYDQLLALARRIRLFYNSNFFRAEVWPLMKLGRIADVRATAKLAIATGDHFEEVIALNGLCAIDGYPACKATLEAVHRHELPPGLALRNLAVSAVQIGRFDEAEELLVESTMYPEPDSNPWRDLTNLYIDEGRLAEASAAAAKMVQFSRHVPPRPRQYTRSEELTTSAKVLHLAGHPERALAATTRALAEPDRAAHWSGSAEEIRAETELLHRSVHLTLAELDDEAAHLLPIHRAPFYRLRAIRHRIEGWLSGRQTLPLMIGGGFRPQDRAEDLDRPELAGSSYLVPDAVSTFGAGPTLALIHELSDNPPGEEAPVPAVVRESYLRAIECEALALRGEHEACLAAGARAREILPAGEVLLRARLALRMAESARELGEWETAAPLYAEILRTDPGLFRRLGVRFPVQAPGRSATLPARAAGRLANSPRFVRDAQSPFAFSSAGEMLCLVAPTGAGLACAADPGFQDPASEGEAEKREKTLRLRAVDLEDPERRLALAFLEVAFAPRIDLSQGDLDTLDGAPVSERGLDERSLELLMYPSARKPQQQ